MSDSDWATRHSTSGYIFWLNNGAVSWKSKKQNSVALSSTEAEIVAASTCALELVFLRTLLIERSDFEEEPPKKFFRLKPGGEVRLRYGYVIRCDEVVKDASTGEVVELRCSHDPDTRQGAGKKAFKTK